MSFLHLIGGLKLEKQASAVLRYLLVNSDTFRRLFTQHISGQFAPSRIPTFAKGIICQTEFHEIDLLVEADNCFLAIENKLWAEFQDEQPSKYQSTAKEQSANKFDGDESAYRIIVVSPEQRRKEIDRELEKQQFDEPPILVSWQDIQRMLNEVEQKASNRVQVIAELLDEFVEREIGQHANLRIDKDKLIGPTARITNHYQQDFLYRIKATFEMCFTSRMGFGKGTYAGFHFRFSEQHDRNRNWLGFQHTKGVGTELMFQVAIDRQAPEIADWEKREAAGQDRPVHYVFNSDSWPQDRMQWQETIERVIEQLRNCTFSEDDESTDREPEN